jgi:transcriptional regulator with XRE-family HTH domain
MTQPQFAGAIHISQGYIADLENYTRAVNDRIVQLISMTFGVSEEYLKTGKGEMFNKAPADKKAQILSLFDELNPQFQDYVLNVVSQLLKVQQEHKEKIPE